MLNDLADATPSDAVVPAFDASDVRWDIDVRTYANHPRVQYYLGYFQGPARSRMEIFLSRGARYESMIRARFQAEGLPGDLGYLALIESGYSNEAVSRAYAVGMWQFMRGTGRGYGLRVDSWVDERRDPVKATDAAARHLRDLRERFGSLYLAAAAYNAGAGKVSRSLGKLEWDAPSDTSSGADRRRRTRSTRSRRRTPDRATEPISPRRPRLTRPIQSTSTPPTRLRRKRDGGLDLRSRSRTSSPRMTQDITSDAAFFRLASNDLLASETQDYVPKLIAAALIAKAPERYGFSAPVPAPLIYDSLVVHDVTGLDVIARLAGTSLAEIRDLNPQYLRLATPAAVHDGDPPAGRHRRGGGRALRRPEPEGPGPLPDPRHRPQRASHRGSRRAIACRSARSRRPTPTSGPPGPPGAPGS